MPSWNSNRIFDRPSNGREISSSVFGLTRRTRLYIFSFSISDEDHQYLWIGIDMKWSWALTLQNGKWNWWQYDARHIDPHSPCWWSWRCWSQSSVHFLTSEFDTFFCIRVDYIFTVTSGFNTFLHQGWIHWTPSTGRYFRLLLFSRLWWLLQVLIMMIFLSNIPFYL